MTKFVISSGHGKYIRGASGYLDEVNEARRVVEKVAEFIRQTSHSVVTFHDDVSTSQSANLNRIVSYHNSQTRDYDVSVHFNAYQTTSKPMGTEVLYVTQQSLAARVSSAIAGSVGFLNRGAKKRTDLSFLNNTNKPAILIETCFVDSSHDANLYRPGFDAVCRAIAESITGSAITAPPVEPPVEPPTEPPPITEDNRIDVTTEWSDESVRLVVNDSIIREGAGDTPTMLNVRITRQGDALLVINGEEFHNYPPVDETTPPPVDTDDPYAKPVEDRPTLRRGSKGPDVTDLQDMLNWSELNPGLIVDGDFGPATETAVYAYQGSRGLTYDGIAGQQTWQSLYAKAPPLPAPPHALTTQEIKDITAIANNSAIRRYNWRNRGNAPQGYTQGMALAFAQSYRKLRAGHAAVNNMSRAATTSSTDALYVYRNEYAALGMSNAQPGANTLRHLYALMLGSGMRESSGKHCTGKDQSASNTSAETAEAGLFQTSWNARSFSSPHFTDLMTEYSNPVNKPTCYLPSFAEGVSCSQADWQNWGSGQGVEFQKLCKECPPFATETHGLTLRSRCDHYGPIIRKEAELKAEANDMFKAVQDYIDSQEPVA